MMASWLTYLSMTIDFTEENLSTIPTMDSHADVPSMPDILISQFGIHQLLTTLDEHKASGPDHS